MAMPLKPQSGKRLPDLSVIHPSVALSRAHTPIPPEVKALQALSQFDAPLLKESLRWALYELESERRRSTAMQERISALEEDFLRCSRKVDSVERQAMELLDAMARYPEFRGEDDENLRKKLEINGRRTANESRDTLIADDGVIKSSMRFGANDSVIDGTDTAKQTDLTDHRTLSPRCSPRRRNLDCTLTERNRGVSPRFPRIANSTDADKRRLGRQRAASSNVDATVTNEWSFNSIYQRYKDITDPIFASSTEPEKDDAKADADLADTNSISDANSVRPDEASRHINGRSSGYVSRKDSNASASTWFDRLVDNMKHALDDSVQSPRSRSTSLKPSSTNRQDVQKSPSSVRSLSLWRADPRTPLGENRSLFSPTNSAQQSHSSSQWLSPIASDSFSFSAVSEDLQPAIATPRLAAATEKLDAMCRDQSARGSSKNPTWFSPGIFDSMMDRVKKVILDETPEQPDYPQSSPECNSSPSNQSAFPG